MNLAFHLDNTKYTLGLSKEEVESNTDGSSSTYKIQLQANNRMVTLSKKVLNGGEPEFSMDGPGMTEAEQLDFVKNWLTVVHGEYDQILGGLSGGQAPDGIKSFFMIFDHFFKDRVIQGLGLETTGADEEEDTSESEDGNEEYMEEDEHKPSAMDG